MAFLGLFCLDPADTSIHYEVGCFGQRKRADLCQPQMTGRNLSNKKTTLEFEI